MGAGRRVTDDDSVRPKRPRGRPRAVAAGETVVRIMLPAEIAAKADRIGGLGQAALTALVMRLLDEAERNDQATGG